MKKNILFVYNTMMIGGSTTALISLLNSIDYDVFDVDLLLYRVEGPLLKYVPKQVNILPQADIGASKFKKLFKMIKSGFVVKAVWHALKYKKKVGVMPQDMAFAKNAICRSIAKVYDVAVGGLEMWPNAFVNECVSAETKISWIHTDYAKNGYLAQLEEWSLKKTNYIVCVSDELTKRFKAHIPGLSSKVFTIENIVSRKLIEDLSKEPVEERDLFNRDGIKLITVARTTIYQKRLDRAIEVLKKLIDDGLMVTWYLIGDGADFLKLKKMAEENGVADFFVMLGARSNPYPYYKQCDLFVLVSEIEGKPIVVTESLSLGTPVLVTRYDSASAQIDNEVNGIIVDNDADSVYKKLSDLLRDSKQLEKLKNNAISYKSNSNNQSYEKFSCMCKVIHGKGSTNEQYIEDK